MSLSECQSGNTPFGDDFNAIDGDIDIDDTVSVAVTVYDSDGSRDDIFEVVNGRVTKCKQDAEEGSYIIEYKAEQDSNSNRFSYYHIAATIGDSAPEKKDVIKLKDGLDQIKEWELDWSAGKGIYIISKENDPDVEPRRLQFVQETDSIGAGNSLLSQVQTSGFALDESGYVIYTGQDQG